MDLSFFGLDHQPFENAPNPATFVSLSSHQRILEILDHAISARKGLMLLTGTAGTGKTLITRLLKERLGTEAAVAFVARPCETAQDVWRAIADGFHLHNPPTTTDGSAAQEFERFALNLYAQDIPVVLIVDAAHELPDDGLRLVRQLAALEADDMPLVQVILVGTPALAHRVLDPAAGALRQRVYRHIEIKPLTVRETELYIDARMRMAGATDEPIFDVDTIPIIHARTGGVARLINLLCDALLGYSVHKQIRMIDDQHVREIPFAQEFDADAYAAEAAGIEPHATAMSKLDAHPVIQALQQRCETLETQLAKAFAEVREAREPQAATARQLRRFDRFVNRMVPMLRSLRDFRSQSTHVLAECRDAADRLETLLAEPASILHQATTLADQTHKTCATVHGMLGRLESAQAGMLTNVESAQQKMLDQARSLHAGMGEQLAACDSASQQLQRQIEKTAPSIERIQSMIDVLRRIHDATQDRCNELDSLTQRAHAVCETLPDRMAELQQIVEAPKQTLERVRLTDGILRKRIETGERLIEEMSGLAKEMRELTESARRSRTHGPTDEDEYEHFDSSRQAPAEALGTDPHNLARRVQELRNLVQNMRRPAERTATEPATTP